jgi:hypothetical protein
MIMGMYTDWGNLKVVSCVAWLNGAGPGSSTAYRWNGRVGGVHFCVKRARWLPPQPRKRSHGSRLGDAENIRYSSICF